MLPNPWLLLKQFILRRCGFCVCVGETLRSFKVQSLFRKIYRNGQGNSYCFISSNKCLFLLQVMNKILPWFRRLLKYSTSVTRVCKFCTQSTGVLCLLRAIKPFLIPFYISVCAMGIHVLGQQFQSSVFRVQLEVKSDETFPSNLSF